MKSDVSLFDGVPARLREERLRLGLTQDELAAIGDVSKNTQFHNEKLCRAIDPNYYNKIAARGIDVFYILTGVRSDDGKTVRDGSASYGAGDDKVPPELKALVESIIKLWYSSTITKEQIDGWRKMFDMMNPFINPQAVRNAAPPTDVQAPVDVPKTDPNDLSLLSRRPGGK